MPIVTYGYRGRPLLLFPTAAADFLENDRFFLVKAVEPAIQAGQQHDGAARSAQSSTSSCTSSSTATCRA